MLVKNILAVVLSVVVLSPSHGQDMKVVDSLTLLLSRQLPGERFESLFELTFQYVQRNNRVALDFIQKAEQDALISKKALSIVKAKRVGGQLLHILEQSDESSKSFREALPIAVDNEFITELYFIEIGLGKNYLFKSKYDSALLFHYRSLATATRIKDEQKISDALHNIGVGYYKLKDYRKGLEYFLKSCNESSYVPGQKFHYLSNIGLCYFHLGELGMAKLYIERSLLDCGPDCRESALINIEYARGLISSAENETLSAEQHFIYSYNLAKKYSDTRFQLDNIYLLSEIYIRQRLFRKAEFYLKEAESLIGPKTPFRLEMIKIYSRFAELYRVVKNFRKSAEYQYLYSQLKDSTYNEELINSLMRTEAEFLERENKAKIEAQAEVILLNERIIERQTIVNLLSASIAIVVLTFLVTLLKGYQIKKNMNRLLEEKIKERTRALEISRNELVTSLNERDSIIRHTVHDIKVTVESIRGLCYLGMREISEPIARSYIFEIEKTTRRLPD